MWFMEGSLEQKNELLCREKETLCCEKVTLRKEKDTLRKENSVLQSREKLLKDEMNTLQKEYERVRDRLVFLEFEHEDLKKEFRVMKMDCIIKEHGHAKELCNAKLENDKMEARLREQELLYATNTRKLDSQLKVERSKNTVIQNQLRIAERTVEIGENQTRAKQEALVRVDAQLKKVLKEKKEMSEILANHGINLFQGKTSSN